MGRLQTLAVIQAGGAVKRLDLYIGKVILLNTLLTWLVVIALEGLFAFLGEMGDIGRGDYELGDAILYILLVLPGRAYQAFPMSVLIGSLLGLGGLAAQAELLAFRLSGCSPARFTRAVLQAGVLMLVAVVLMGEGWAPLSRQIAGQLRTSAIFDEVSVQGDSGFWVRDGQRLIQVGQSEADGSLSRLVVFEIDATPRLVSAASASRARYQQGRWLLEDLQVSHFNDQTVKVENTERIAWPTLMDPRLARLLTRDPQTLSLPDLHQYIAYLRANDTDVSSYRLNYWQRWAAPLAAIAMLFLSVSFVLGPLGKQSGGQRVLAGVVLGLVFKLINDITAHAGLVYGMPPWLSAALPSSVVFAAGLLLLRRRS
jgi:lipopolysaccharide export system permease protein